MKILKRFLALISLAAACTALQSFQQNQSVVIKGSGRVVNETRQVGPITSINVNSGIELIVRRGDKQSVSVESNRNIVPYIETKVERGVLYLRIKSRTIVQRSSGLKAYVTLPRLNELSASGRSTVVLKDKFISDGKMYIKAGVGSQIEGYIECFRLEAAVAGGSTLDLAGKVTGKCDLMVSSGSTFEGSSLACNDISVNATSSAVVRVRANNTIEINAASASKVYYKGKAKVIGLNLVGKSVARKG